MTGSPAMYGIAAVERMTGIPAAKIRQWQESAGASTQGTDGLGIALFSRDDVQAIVEFARGTDAANSDVAHRPTGHADLRDVSAKQQGGPKLLILLAERDDYAAELAEYFLRTEGYGVETAFDTAEALRCYGQMKPDIAIVELLIDGGAGFELCERLAEIGECPVIAMSALDPEGHPALAGVDAVLRKPVRPLTLVSTVRDLLGTSAILNLVDDA